MKFLIFSDSHNYTNGMDYAIENHKDIHHIIHCGDMAADIDYLHAVYGVSHSICGVCGNNDFIANEPLKRIIPYKTNKIYVTHGHREHVKASLYELKSEASSSGCNICIFGHTHQQFFATESGLTIFNPGSIGYFKQEYAIMEITENKVDVLLKKL